MVASACVQHKFDIMLSIFLGIVIVCILQYYLMQPVVFIINKNKDNDKDNGKGNDINN